MTSPFTAEDLMRRSLLGSIIGFGKKKNKNVAVAETDGSHPRYPEENCLAGCSFRTSASNACLPEVYLPSVRTATDIRNKSDETEHVLLSEQDIYREIVAECARFEENNKTEPPVTQQNVRTPTGAGLLDEDTTNAMVKLIVETVMEIIDGSKRGFESPEEILRKKRLQNNEAAARYRKRQKELREETEIEVRILENRNHQLWKQIENMQLEIDRLKKEVQRKNAE